MRRSEADRRGRRVPSASKGIGDIDYGVIVTGRTVALCASSLNCSLKTSDVMVSVVA